MRRFFSHIAAPILALPLLAVAVPHASASAATADLYLNSFSYSVPTYNGIKPTLNTGTVDTSNAGRVTSFTLPYDFHLTQGVEASPSSPVFIVEPHNSSGVSTATVQVTFTFGYNSATYALTENVSYYANAYNDYDSLVWQPGTDGTCTGSRISDSCTYAFAISGQNFTFTLDNETDWNMAQFDGAKYVGPASTVPEPASVLLLGAAVAGIGLIRRRQKA